MARIFISYARQDHERVAPYTAALRDRGYDVWWDEAIPGGEDWSNTIERELDRADAVVLFWSRDSVQSPWVRIEAHFAKRHNCMVPVRLDGIDPPDEYRLLQVVDAIHSPFEEAVVGIESAIRQIRHRNQQRRITWTGAALVAALVVGVASLLLAPDLRPGASPEAASDHSWQALREADTLGDLGEIERRFEELAGERPKLADNHAGLCAVNLRRYEMARRDGDLKMARTRCDTALALAPHSPRAAEANGWLAYHQGEHDGALGEFRRALNLAPQQGWAWLGLAMVLEGQGKADQARAALSEAIVAQPGSWRAQNDLALFLQRQGYHDQALQRFQFALKLDPENESLLNNIGISHFFTGDYGSAVAAWDQVLQNTPLQDQGPTLTNLGSAYYLMQDFPAAQTAFSRATGLLGDDYRVWGNLADVHSALGAADHARTSYRRALDRAQLQLESNPQDALALAASASFLSALREPGWQPLIDEALQKAPEDPEVRRLAAVAHLHSDDHDQARLHLDSAVELGYPQFLIDLDYQFADIAD